MITLSSICIIVIIAFFLFIGSIKFIVYAMPIKKTSINTLSVIMTILFLVSLGAVIPRLCIWLF